MSSQLLHFLTRPATRQSSSSPGLLTYPAQSMADTSSPLCAWTTGPVSTMGLPTPSTSRGGSVGPLSAPVGSR